VLEYIRSTFSSEFVLDAIPLEAAANPGAYHAWRAYRADVLQSQQPLSSPDSPPSDSQSGVPTRAPNNLALGRNRRPGAWNWEGVWEERVRKAVKASLSEPVLFGGTSAGEDIVSLPNPCHLDLYLRVVDSLPGWRRRDHGKDEDANGRSHVEDC
jgi:hypothetical protein